jgi:hypothetical protein
MTEYVYALHDFVPENEDEISFRAGDRIEVIERDEEFQDGWWQVRRSPSLPPNSFWPKFPVFTCNVGGESHTDLLAIVSGEECASTQGGCYSRLKAGLIRSS